jgi:hypothetical protein
MCDVLSCHISYQYPNQILFYWHVKYFIVHFMTGQFCRNVAFLVTMLQCVICHLLYFKLVYLFTRWCIEIQLTCSVVLFLKYVLVHKKFALPFM